MRTVASALKAGLVRVPGLKILAVLLGLYQPLAVLAQARTEPQAASILATSLILTDSDVIHLGLVSFDPDDLIPYVNSGAGSDESVERRRNLLAYAIPSKWQLTSAAKRSTLAVKTRFSYMRAKQEIFSADTSESHERARVYGAYIEACLTHQLTSKWQASTGAGVHLLQYIGRHGAGGSAFSILEPQEGEAGVEAYATALMFELQPRLTYSSEFLGINWQFRSTYSYYAGQTVRTQGDASNVTPETWSWSNGLVFRRELAHLSNTRNELRVFMHRVDLGGDVLATLGTHSYYELGAGWLFETKGGISWLDSLGISLAFNTHSAFGGGSVGVLYNEEF